ncbi:MAG: hypothetical protein QM311_00985 [Acidobacteriota bacterium]|jgi:hypothetical protein|nr:hypothetical protein [Acidobacteriota bacterium]
MTYDQQRLFMTRELIAGCDLFLLELMRDYDGWRRAEGIVASAYLHATGGRPSLIFSSYAVAAEVASIWYWDLASRDTLEERIRSLVECDTSWPDPGLARLERLFAAFLERPREH